MLSKKGLERHWFISSHFPISLILLLLFLTLILNGCNTTASRAEEAKLKWFKTKNEAIQYGLKEEEIEENDIIDTLECNGELFVVYMNGETVGLSNLAQKNGNFAWYRSDAQTQVKDDLKISFITETLSKKKFHFYFGKVKASEITIETNKGEVSPLVDNNKKLYYYITPK